MNLTDVQAVCLIGLESLTAPFGEMCVGFGPVQRSTRVDGTPLDRSVIRRAIRSLARKGLAEYHKGLVTEDGEFAGAGYCITNEGIKFLESRRS